MRSIRGSKFITIDSGECGSFNAASTALDVKAEKIPKALYKEMPVELVKVEVISYTKPSAKTGNPITIWFATSLMVKI